MNRRDAIDIEIRSFRVRTIRKPSYIVINRDDYFILKEELGFSFDKEITIFAGCDLLVTMDTTKEVMVL